MSINLDNIKQNIYNITCNIIYKNGNDFNNISVPYKNIRLYNVSKNSKKFNFNLHNIIISGFSYQEKELLNNSSTRINISILENGHTISNKNFYIEKVEILDNEEQFYNLNIFMISQLSKEFLTSNKFSKSSSSNELFHETSFKTLTYIFQDISLYYNNLDIYYNSSGKIKTLYESLRIPENIQDMYIIDYLIKNAPIYILTPYFILDDLHLDSKKDLANISSYNIHLINLVNINANYNFKNINLFKGYSDELSLLSNEPICDSVLINSQIESKLILKNSFNNSLKIITPEFSKNDKVINIDTNLEINDFIKKLEYLKKLSDEGATFERHKYRNLNLGDISFGYCYNIQQPVIYDHTPIIIEYEFYRNNRDSFDLTTNVEYAKIPESLLNGY